MNKYQIEEMSEVTMEHCEIDNQCGSCKYETCNECLADVLYNAGYRKQSEGEWIWTENGDEDYEQFWICSVCNEKSYIETKFCPDCGAKMKGASK